METIDIIVIAAFGTVALGFIIYGIIRRNKIKKAPKVSGKDYIKNNKTAG